VPWVRFDDQFPIHRKVKGLGDPAFRLHAEAIFWCARNLTDGYVPAADLPDLATARRPLKLVPELVSRGNWHQAGQACKSESCPAHADRQPESARNGWIIHDYFEYQPSKAKVERERKAKAGRQQRWLEKQRHTEDASIDASQDAAPPRPAPKEAGAGEKHPRRGAPGRANPAGSPVRAVPKWCGKCDEATRLMDPDRPRRCPNCHPLRNEEAS
jgi:hypothetical protein